MRKTFNEWTSTVDKEATRLLEIPLMRRSLDRSGTLDLNFDRLIFHLLFHYSLLSYKSICLDKEFILILIAWLVFAHTKLMYYNRSLSVLGPMTSICHPHQSYQPVVTSKMPCSLYPKLSLLKEYACHHCMKLKSLGDRLSSEQEQSSLFILLFSLSQVPLASMITVTTCRTYQFLK